MGARQYTKFRLVGSLDKKQYGIEAAVITKVAKAATSTLDLKIPISLSYMNRLLIADPMYCRNGTIAIGIGVGFSRVFSNLVTYIR